MDASLPLGVLPGPVNGFRSNNPHPKWDFLLPKTLTEVDSDQQLQARVHKAAQRYLDKLGYSQSDPPAKILHNVLQASHTLQDMDMDENIGCTTEQPRAQVVSVGKAETNDFINKSLQLLEDTRKDDKEPFKRERYNSIPAPKFSGNPKPSSSKRKSSRLLSSSGEELIQQMKYNQAPTPPGTGSRPQSVNYEAQRVAQRKSIGLPKRPITAADVTLFNPRMKSWVDGANDYEREVAYNMLQSLKGNRNKSAKRVMLPNATGVYIPGSGKFRNTKEDAMIQQMMTLVGKDVDRTTNTPSLYASAKRTENRPSHRHIRRAPSFDGYVHLGSSFSPTKPPCRGSFDIAPDWCSEAKTYRRLVKRATQNQAIKSI